MLVRIGIELTNKIFPAQKRDHIKGDWIAIVQEGREKKENKHQIDDEEWGKPKKSVFKKH